LGRILLPIFAFDVNTRNAKNRNSLPARECLQFRTYHARKAA
jgi:hypothetical protein